MKNKIIILLTLSIVVNFLLICYSIYLYQYIKKTPYAYTKNESGLNIISIGKERVVGFKEEKGFFLNFLIGKEVFNYKFTKDNKLKNITIIGKKENDFTYLFNDANGDGFTEYLHITKKEKGKNIRWHKKYDLDMDKVISDLKAKEDKLESKK